MDTEEIDKQIEVLNRSGKKNNDDDYYEMVEKA